MFAEVFSLLATPEYATWRDPNPERARVDALDHALQCATRAERADADDELVIAALLHDAARPLNDIYHGEVIAEMLRGRVRDEVYRALYHHGLFQSDLIHGTRQARLLYGRHGWFETAQRLAGWDAASFDPNYESFPLDHFHERLRAITTRYL